MTNYEVEFSLDFNEKGYVLDIAQVVDNLESYNFSKGEKSEALNSKRLPRARASMLTMNGSNTVVPISNPEGPQAPRILN